MGKNETNIKKSGPARNATHKALQAVKTPTRRFWKIAFVFAVAFFVLFIATNHASALTQEQKDALYAPEKAVGGWLLEKASGPVVAVFQLLLVGVLKIMSWMLGLAVIIFDYIIKSKNVESIMSNTGIYQSWAMVRDFLNLGFILVLLYIAFCVIFQIGSYSDSWKKMLLMMVIMALLVNFSFPICRVIIDFSNVAFYYLVNIGFPGKSGDAIFTQITKDVGFGDILGNVGTDPSVAKLIAMIIFTFILAITLLVIAILFVVRMVAIGILIIFSPIGFAGAAFPFSKKYASQWWDNLFKYAFFAPIMMFMILIASKIMEVMSINEKLSVVDSAKKNLGTDLDPNMFGSMAFFAIPIVILWFGMHMAQTMSIAGASAVTGAADKAAKWAGSLPWRGAKFGASAAWDKTQRVTEKKWGVSPRSFLKAWKARKEDINRETEEVASGKTWDRLNSVMSLGKEKTRHGEEALERQILREQKEIGEVSQDSGYLINELKSAKDAGDKVKAAAIMRILFNNNDQNEFMKHYINNGRGGVVDPYQMTKEIEKLFVDDMGMDKNFAARQASDLGEIAVSKGNYGNYGMGLWNKSTNQYEFAAPEDQMGASLSKASNIRAQAKVDNWHWNSFLQEDVNGDAGHLHGFGQAQLDALTGAEIEQITRMRNDFASKMMGAVGEIETYANTVARSGRAEDIEQSKRIRQFAEAIKNKGAKPKGSGGGGTPSAPRPAGSPDADLFGNPI